MADDGDEGRAIGGHEVFVAGGDVGRHLAAVDWSATPLGEPSTWPQSLWTPLRIVLTSRFSMWMAWGPELTFFCNEAYRRDTLGKKYPWALGRPAGEVWAEIWPDIEPRIRQVMTTGVATWDDSLMLFLERSGYVEETYHTFSYSPLATEDGRIEGMLCVVSEETERVIGERRMATLRSLGADLMTARREAEVLDTACRSLAGSQRCVPFSLLYLFADDARTAALAGGTGFPPGHPAAPRVIEVGGSDGPWPAEAALAGRATLVQGLGDRWGDLPTGSWADPPDAAYVVPLLQQGQGPPYGFLVAGLNPYRPVDEPNRGFVQLLAGQVAAGIATARAYEAERRRAEELAELDRAKTLFFTNISHEFRTPLTLLLGPANDALADRRHPLPDPQRHRMEMVQRNGDRLLKLVNTLLDFSRLESGRTDARFEPIDLAQYTAELASMFESAFERAGLQLTVDARPLPGPVHVDTEMWAKIVLNLLSNALKFTFSGGVAVSVTADGPRAVLTVQDTGIGIDPSEQPRLFERFHRVSGARSRTHEGSGIGLSLVAELARLHGGEVQVESSPGEGSTFRVAVPIGTAHLPAERVSTEPARPPVADRRAQSYLAEALRWLEGRADGGPADLDTGEHAGAGARPRVLVVDDNPDMRSYVAELLRDECSVETAPDGAVGLEMARRRTPDLVLTDVMMPNLDGFGLLAALRADPDTCAVPVLMLSARAGDEGVVEGLEAGADDYLVKPFSARELLARVRSNLELDRARRVSEQLERSRQLLDQAQRLAGVGSWELDLSTGAITASDEFARQLRLSTDELKDRGLEHAFATRVHADDAAAVRAALERAARGEPLDVEARIVLPGGEVRVYRALGELERDDAGRPVRLRGSNQDVTEQRLAEEALALAAAQRESIRREQQIADELQRSLLPERAFHPDHLEVSTFYRAGVEGTQVGGDWYDVVDLGAGRTALVVGDVMGRGVRAAAVMGQLRAAVRAYARLDLPPADVLELLDGVVRDLGEDQIVTCAYAVYDSTDRTLSFASAGHLPPVLSVPGSPPRVVPARGQPLGTGPLVLTEERVELPEGSTVVLYTDGLVERRTLDLEDGISALLHRVESAGGPIDALPADLAGSLASETADDDIAVLVARVSPGSDGTAAAHLRVDADQTSPRRARRFAEQTLAGWRVERAVVDTVMLLTSELVTNALRHGRPPIDVRLRRTSAHVVLEVHDTATAIPRRLRPHPDDDRGRGLQLVALLTDRWGVRPTRDGKSMWCTVPLGVALTAVAGT